MTTNALVAALLGLALGGTPARGSGPIEPENIVAAREIVLTTVGPGASVRREALRASRRLGYAIALETTTDVPALRRHLGPVIAAHRNDRGQVVITSFLGDATDMAGPLHEARRYYPRATIVPVELAKEPIDVSDAPLVPAGILVVASHPTYAGALRAAQAFSRASGIAFQSRGMIFDKKRGLIWPDDAPDDIWAGRYAPRRDDEVYPQGPSVSIERSEAYWGFKPHLYVVVAGIVSGPSTEERLAAARRYAPDAYVKQTVLYMGCMH